MRFSSREAVILKNFLWRKPGEKAAELPDIEAILWHACRGGLRSAILGSSLHALLNLLLLLIRRKKPHLPLKLIFSRDVLRFGASLGAFTSLYRILLNTTRHNAFFSGAAAGTLATLLSPNTTLSQQLLMRGVQGFLSTRGIHPSPILLFSLACAQIMYANLRAPHSLPPAYRSYVVKGARVPPEAIRMSYSGRDELSLQHLLNRKGKWECTPANKRLLSSWTDSKGPIPCRAFHPDHDRCWTVPPPRLADGAKFMLPIYAALHVLPALLLRPASLLKHPTRVPFGIARSCAFFGLYVYVNQLGICLRSAGAPIGYWFPGLASGIALGVEAPRRRLELALYVLPKAVESAWICLGLPRTWVGEVIMTALGAGLVMKTYQEQPKHLAGAVRAVMYQLVGNN